MSTAAGDSPEDLDKWILAYRKWDSRCIYRRSFTNALVYKKINGASSDSPQMFLDSDVILFWSKCVKTETRILLELLDSLAFLLLFLEMYITSDDLSLVSVQESGCLFFTPPI